MAVLGTVLSLATGGLGGLLGGGADAKKYAERKGGYVALKALAESGNADAWLALGAMGGRLSLPSGLSFPGIPYASKLQAGWNSDHWGDAYDPIVKAAAKAYDALAPRFRGQGTAVIAAPAAPGAIAPVAGAIPPTVAGIPTWALVAGVLALLVLGLSFMGRKG